MKSSNAHNVFLSIGSNLGDKWNNCQNAIEAIEESGIGHIIARSPFYHTEPVDYAEQDWFLNAALRIETSLNPLMLLYSLQEIQASLGRNSKGVRFGPRTIDLDIIFFDNILFENEDLMIPHPRMHKRRFVLQPICDIDPQIIHPRLGKTVLKLLEQLQDNNGQRIFRSPCAS